MQVLALLSNQIWSVNWPVCQKESMTDLYRCAFHSEQNAMLPLSVPTPPQWSIQTKQKINSTKSWNHYSTLFPKKTSCQFLVTSVLELGQIIRRGKGLSEESESETALAMDTCFWGPARHMTCSSLTQSSVCLSTTQHHGCILAWSTGISLTMSSLGKRTDRTSQEEILGECLRGGQCYRMCPSSDYWDRKAPGNISDTLTLKMMFIIPPSQNSIPNFINISSQITRGEQFMFLHTCDLECIKTLSSVVITAMLSLIQTGLP